MKRRVCESCYFYEAAGIVNSGWCRHPDRQFSTGVRLVVRGNELNCRNGWDIDLWVPAGIEPGANETSSGEWSAAEAGDDQITSIVPARYEREEPAEVARAESEDVVVRHAPYAGYAPPEKEARDLVTNPRAAILKAREQFKVRQLREGRIADRFDRPILADPADEAQETSANNSLNGNHGDHDDHLAENAPFLGAGAPSARRVPEYSVPPVSREEMNRPFVSITYYPEDDRRFESIPDEIAEIPVQQRQPAPEPAFQEEPELQLSFEDDPFDDWLGDELVAENGGPPRPPKQRRRSFVDRLLGDRRQRRPPSTDEYDYPDVHYALDDEGQGYLDERPIDPPMPAQRYVERSIPTREFEQAPEALYMAGPEFTADDHHPSRQPYTNGRHAPERDAYDDNLEWAMAPLEEAEYVYQGRPERRQAPLPANRSDYPPQGRRGHGPRRREAQLPDHAYDSPQPVTPPDDLPRWNSAGSEYREPAQPAYTGRAIRPLAPDLPQICRTCRDFRPTESGDRGWCNNSYAFMHRRMVDADVLSCESSFGNWWIAHDGVWQKAADVSRHALETPLLDRLLGIQEYTDSPPHRSGSGR